MSAREQDQWLIVSDIDDTLTGDRDSLERLWAALQPLRGSVRLALNSSRPAASVDETIRSYFPAGFAPDAIITGLGTEIRIGGASCPTGPAGSRHGRDRRSSISCCASAISHIGMNSRHRARQALPYPMLKP